MTCPTCQYPMTASTCENPGCAENPSIPQSTKDRWALERTQREADEAERNKMARLWGASFHRSTPTTEDAVLDDIIARAKGPWPVE